MILSLLMLIFLLQSIFLPCLCDRGTAKMILAFVVHALILVRVLIARLHRETNRDWIFYLAMGTSSLVWIPLAVGD